MTVTMQNVDLPFFEVLQSLVKLHSSVVMRQEDETEENVSLREPQSLQKMREASLATVWESVKNDAW